MFSFFLNRAKLLKGIVFAAAVLLAIFAGWHLHKWYVRHYENIPDRRVVLKGAEFTSPLLDVELPEGLTISKEPNPFKYRVEEYIRENVKKGDIRNIAVYYRDLHDGPWFGINQKSVFNPASMMKVAVMIAWLKRAEKNPAILKRTMYFDGLDKEIPEQHTKPAREIKPGQNYLIEELLHYMIAYSDNKATSLLFKGLSEEELGEVLENMDVNNNPNEEGNSVTIHGYSGFFRILYNAAYLNREMSERALWLLSQEDFPQGIAGGVPWGVKVAAKFGEVVPQDPGQDMQLHEFGIIYHSTQPYILGVMTLGRNYEKQATIIRDISRLVYQAVDRTIKE